MPPDILMPALSPTMEEGKLAKWHVKEGDTVRPGDILAEIETDKATMEFEAVDEGEIEKLLVPEGAEGVKINAPIARLITDESPPAKTPEPPRQAVAAPALAPTAPAVQPVARMPPPAEPQKAAAKSGNGQTAPDTEHRIFASPLAKRIALDKGIDLAHVQGSGPRGRIVKADVEAALQSTAPAPAVRQPSTTTSPPAPVAETVAPAGVAAGLAPLPDAHLFFKDTDYEAVPNDSMR